MQLKLLKTMTMYMDRDAMQQKFWCPSIRINAKFGKQYSLGLSNGSWQVAGGNVQCPRCNVCKTILTGSLQWQVPAAALFKLRWPVTNFDQYLCHHYSDIYSDRCLQAQTTLWKVSRPYTIGPVVPQTIWRCCLGRHLNCIEGTIGHLSLSGGEPVTWSRPTKHSLSSQMHLSQIQTEQTRQINLWQKMQNTAFGQINTHSLSHTDGWQPVASFVKSDECIFC